jgi:Fic family protein
VVRGDGVVLHRGAPPIEVPQLVKEVFEWGSTSLAHPLIKSSAIHFLIEHIHPFRDGNGRIGRLWQTLILSKWNAFFAWVPIETIVHFNQALYYQALQESHDSNIDCKPFIEFMLNMIEGSMYKYIDIATETVSAPDDPDNDSDNDLDNLLLSQIEKDPQCSYEKLAKAVGKSTATIKRHIKSMKEKGLIQRYGSDRSGYWVIKDKENS